MNKLIKKATLPTAIVAALASSSAFATNGLAPTGLGQAHKAMGGAATANPVSTMSMATNPAAAGFIDDGWDVGLEIFQPNRKATAKATGTEFNGDGDSTFLIPEGGYKRTLSNGQSVGVSVYGNGGMNTRYTTNPGFGTGDAGVDLQQLIISPTWGMKVNEKTSVGISANLAYQKFKAYGIQNFNFLSSSSGNVSNNGYDSSTGIGASIGIQSKVSDKVMLGASYRSKISMGKLDKYKGLFPDQGALDMPAALNLGLSAQVTPKTQIAADVERIYYSSIAAVGNRADIALPLGSTDAAGFGWDDQNIIKIGVKHQIKPKLALMAGYNHGKSPVGSEETNFNVLAPGVVEDHLSLGFEYKLNDKSSLTGSYTRAFSNKVSGDTTQGQGYDIEMDQNAIGLGYSKKF